MKRKHGFTLVELLVVISIIALLLAILMPSLTKAKLAAQRIVCNNSMRQQIIYQITYATDSKGKFADFKMNEPMYVRQANWTGCKVWDLYKPYFGSGASKILVCPWTAKIALQDRWDTWGFFAKTNWLSKSKTSGGWDAKLPNGVAPMYVMIPYEWYMGFQPADGSKIYFQADAALSGSDTTLKGSETPWPRTLAECSSKAIAVSHPINVNPNNGGLRDLSHGGSLTAQNSWDRRTGRWLGKAGSLDAPAGYSDGHIETHYRNTTGANGIKPRAGFNYKGNVAIFMY